MKIVEMATFADAQLARGQKITAREGALILSDLGGEPQHLIEKIMDGQRFVGQPLNQIKWKKNPVVYVVGAAGKKLLAQIEAMAPGFTAFKA